jgi:hypothetical protein
MDRHVAEVTVLESFDLGKNTAQSAGIEIKVMGYPLDSGSPN